MGLVIVTDHNTLKKDEDVEVSETCIVCQTDKENKDINDVERIFRALENARQSGEDISKLDEKMCDYHAKKARGLKIVAHDDHLMELDATTVSTNPNRVADAKEISKEEYEKQVEIEDGEINV
jgi:hypothetical protein